MLIINIKGLIERKSAIERRKITYKVMENETGMKVLTLSRIASNHDYNISRKDIEKLLIYFRCQPNELMTLIPEEWISILTTCFETKTKNRNYKSVGFYRFLFSSLFISCLLFLNQTPTWCKPLSASGTSLHIVVFMMDGAENYS